INFEQPEIKNLGCRVGDESSGVIALLLPVGGCAKRDDASPRRYGRGVSRPARGLGSVGWTGPSRVARPTSDTQRREASPRPGSGRSLRERRDDTDHFAHWELHQAADTVPEASGGMRSLGCDEKLEGEQ